MKNALKVGGIIGLVSLLFTIVAPMIIGFNNMFSSSWMFGVSLLYLILLAVLGRKMFRPADPNEPLSYGESLKHLFVAMFVGSMIGLIGGTLVLGNNEEAKIAFQEYTEAAQKTGLEWGMSMTGKSEEEIEVELEKMQDKIDSGEIAAPKADYPYSFSMLPMNIFSGVFTSLIFSLIAGLFVRRKEKGIITDV